MIDFYIEQTRFLVAVDCIIFGFGEGELKLLLLKRRFEPAKGQWSLMGGFLKKDESLDDSAKRILAELTGLTEVFMEQLHNYGEIARDPGERVLSTAYYTLIKITESDKALVESNNACWIPVNKRPALIFDHDKMVNDALAKLKRKCRTQPIGFELLPKKFTLPQLQQLYEAINQEKFDKRNFRRKILAMNLLEKMVEKHRGSSKKGAFLYKFDKQRYRKLVEKGFLFEVY